MSLDLDLCPFRIRSLPPPLTPPQEGAQSAAEQAGSALKSAPSKVSGEVQRLGREAIPDGTQPPATASEGTKRWARGSLGEGELQPNKEWLREQVPDSGRR